MGIAHIDRTRLVSDAVQTVEREGFVVLRKAHWSHQQAQVFFLDFADEYGWRVKHPDFNYGAPATWDYREDHGFAISNRSNTGADDLVVYWHMEKVANEFPQWGGMWRMVHKSSPANSGTTGFVDSSTLYDLLDPDDQKFLESCEVISLPRPTRISADKLNDLIQTNERGRNFIMFDEGGNIHARFVAPAVETHHRSQRKCVRFDPFVERRSSPVGRAAKVVRVNGEVPSMEDEERADRLLAHLADVIYSDESIQTWVEWDEGDIIIADLFRMAHAVRGGFAPGERVFEGMWAFADRPEIPADPDQREAYQETPESQILRLG